MVDHEVADTPVSVGCGDRIAMLDRMIVRTTSVLEDPSNQRYLRDRSRVELSHTAVDNPANDVRTRVRLDRIQDLPRKPLNKTSGGRAQCVWVKATHWRVGRLLEKSCLHASKGRQRHGVFARRVLTEGVRVRRSAAS